MLDHRNILHFLIDFIIGDQSNLLQDLLFLPHHVIHSLDHFRKDLPRILADLQGHPLDYVLYVILAHDPLDLHLQLLHALL